MADSLRVTVLALSDKMLLLDFGQPVHRLELPVDDAVTLAMTILNAVGHVQPLKITNAVEQVFYAQMQTNAKRTEDFS